jgi:hypothetical protein
LPLDGGVPAEGPGDVGPAAVVGAVEPASVAGGAGAVAGVVAVVGAVVVDVVLVVPAVVVEVVPPAMPVVAVVELVDVGGWFRPAPAASAGIAAPPQRTAARTVDEARRRAIVTKSPFGGGRAGRTGDADGESRPQAPVLSLTTGARRYLLDTIALVG